MINHLSFYIRIIPHLFLYQIYLLTNKINLIDGINVMHNKNLINFPILLYLSRITFLGCENKMRRGSKIFVLIILKSLGN